MDVSRLKKRRRVDSPESENHINYTSGHPTLEEIAVVSLAIRLWNMPRVVDYIKENKIIRHGLYLKEKREQVENFILQNLNIIKLPEILKVKVAYVIMPVGFHLLQYLNELNVDQHDIDLWLGQQSLVRWTMEGTIDKVKSICELIKYETGRENLERSFKDSELYILACNYCLEEYIPVLWSSLYPRVKKKFKTTFKYDENDLVVYWTAVVKNELPQGLETFPSYYTHNSELKTNQSMVIRCFYQSNIFALKYFWHKLIAEEKIFIVGELLRTSLNAAYIGMNRIEYPTYNESAQILIFLLSEYPCEQKACLQSSWYSRRLLAYMFHTWPLRKHFLSTLEVCMGHSGILHDDIVDSIFKEIEAGRQTEKFLQKVWSMSPLKLRRSLIRHLTPDTLLGLIKCNDIATASLLLKDETTEERKRFIFQLIYPYNFESFYNTVIVASHSRLVLIDELLSENLTSPLILTFKLNTLVNYAIFLSEDIELKPIYEIINWAFQLQDETIKFEEMKFDPLEVYIALILLGNNEHICQFKSWCSKTEENLRMFKSFLLRNNTSTMLRLFDGFSKMGKNGFIEFENLLNTNLPTPKDISQFKRVCRKLFYTSLIRSTCFQQSEFRTPFLNWCFKSEQK